MFKICSQVLVCPTVSDYSFLWSQVVIIPPRIKLGPMDLICCLLKLERLIGLWANICCRKTGRVSVLKVHV